MIEELQRSDIPMHTLAIHLFSPVAAQLGRLWCNDETDFIQVAVASTRLGMIVNHLSQNRSQTIRDRQTVRRVLLARTPGGMHTIGVAIVDLDSGMSLGQAGGGTLNLDIAAAGNTEVVRAKMRTMSDLDLQDEIEDILITLGGQYHVIRPLTGKGSAGLFLYAALDKSKANLALARHKIADICSTLTV